MGMGILREYFCFERSVLSRAFKDTLQFAKQHLVIETLFTVFSAVAGAIMSPLDYSQWANGLIIGVVTVILMFITVGLSNLCLTPFKLWIDQRELLPLENKGNSERLEEIFKNGQELFGMLPDNRGGFLASNLAESWVFLINNWIDKSEQVVEEYAPKSKFMYSSITPRADKKNNADQCRKILSARLGKLRLIIGRMQ